ncbi:hypothetical protein KGF54_001613 [Candida jiufengensis]|uniref:uncharacterized protein n=1 Tax=Candida jiufengensis TaxID=497108 RepID=UPI002224F9D8|nr:uncharacterized protein KGF54_001613 [Candida jiufengensis]KAI5955052.1 hypothetical protein KGF54_001613 [Candida jiufengensis]
MSSIPTQQHSTSIPTGGVPPIGESSSNYGSNSSSSHQQQHTASNPFTDPSNKSSNTAPLASGSSVTPTTAFNQQQHATFNLLTWKDPIYTGKIFGSIIFGLIIFKTINWVNIIFHLSYILLLITAAAEYSGKLITGKGFVTNYKQRSPDSSIAKKFNNEILPIIGSLNIEIETQLKKIFYASDIETTLKASGISYILYKLTSYVSLFNLFVASIILVFTIPFVYTHHKKEIDAAVTKYTNVAKSQISELTTKAHKAAGPRFDEFIKKLGPVGEFVQSKIPTRTAGSTVGTSKATKYGTAADNQYEQQHTTSSIHTGKGNSEITTGAGTTKQPFESSTGVSTGSSKFPNAPTSGLSGLHPTTVEDVANDSFDDFADTTQEYKPSTHKF